MIEKICNSLVKADVNQLPVVTFFTQRAHAVFVPFGASFHGYCIGIHGKDAVEENHHAYHCGRQ